MRKAGHEWHDCVRRVENTKQGSADITAKATGFTMWKLHIKCGVEKSSCKVLLRTNWRVRRLVTNLNSTPSRVKVVDICEIIFTPHCTALFSPQPEEEHYNRREQVIHILQARLDCNAYQKQKLRLKPGRETNLENKSALLFISRRQFHARFWDTKNVYRILF